MTTSDGKKMKTSQLFFRPRASIKGLPPNKESTDNKSMIRFKIEDVFFSRNRKKIIVIISNHGKAIKDIDIVYMYFHLLDEKQHPILMRNTDTIKISIQNL